MKGFKHFNLDERKRIEWFLRKEKSLREISTILGRSVSSISDEIKNNSTRGVYDAKKANHKAYVKREQSKRDCLKVAMDTRLQKFVIEGMENDQSPNGLSGRLKYVQKDIQYTSTKAIYKFIESPHGRQIEQHLYSNAVKKKPGKKRDTPIGIDGRTFIDERPKKIEKRVEFGHFEGDFIESGKDGKGSLLVLVERKTRYPFLVYLEDRSNANVNCLIEKTLRGMTVNSLTLDNDISFQKHPELSELINATIYFCHPQSPHEKGTVENRNKAIRRYVKKRSDLSSFSKEYFSMVEKKLRTRFMKCLNYKTPEECFNQEIWKQKNTLARGIIKKILLTESVRIRGCV